MPIAQAARLCPEATFFKGSFVHYREASRAGSSTLSGGETQRINLATSLGSALIGTLYVLDEPSIGLHPRDNARLINILKSLRDIGNTLLVVEHRVDVWADLVDRIIVLGSEGLLADGPVAQVLAERTAELLAAGVWVPGVPHSLSPRPVRPSGQPLLWTEDLTTGYQASQPVGRTPSTAHNQASEAAT